MVKKKNKGAFRLVTATAITLTLIASPFTSVNAADLPSLGKKCTDEGVNTGTTSKIEPSSLALLPSLKLQILESKLLKRSRIQLLIRQML